MTKLIWPVEGGRAAWPVYRDEAAHIAGGERWGIDLGNQESLAWIAPADYTVVPGTGNDPAANEIGFHAGIVVVIECDIDGTPTRFHYCHGQAFPVAVGWHGAAGDVIGRVGHSGSVWDAQDGFQTVAAAHLHLWVEQLFTDGGWTRVQDIGALFNDDGGDDMTDEAKADIEHQLAVLEVNTETRAQEINQLLQAAAVNLTPAQVQPLNEAVASLATLHDEDAGAIAAIRSRLSL